MESPENLMESPKHLMDPPEDLMDPPEDLMESPEGLMDPPEYLMDSPADLMDPPEDSSNVNLAQYGIYQWDRLLSLSYKNSKYYQKMFQHFLLQLSALNRLVYYQSLIYSMLGC